MPFKCPGTFSRSLKAKTVKCPHCSYEVELFSDEMRRKCPHCKKWVYQKHLPSCTEWCAAAEKCVGKDILKAMEGEA